MHRKAIQAVVRLCLVIPISIAAGVASAETKVACVGDSITEMPGWCSDLGTKLGAGYNVGNFGVSGTNLLKDVGQPYWTSYQFTPSHDFAPDIVIIMLGTNDAIPSTWAGKDHFVADYDALIDSYTSLASHPRVYVNLPPPIGTSPFGHSGDILANEVVPMIRQVAMDKMVTAIDIFTAFGGTMFDPSLFGSLDQVHPSDKGHQLIADTVYAALMSSGGLGGAGTGGNAGHGGSASTGGAGGVSASTGGAGGGVSANTGGAGGGVSANTGSIPSLAGLGGTGIAGGTSSSVVNDVAAAGTSAPMVSAPKSGCGCRMAGNSTSKSGATAGLLLLLGIVIRRRTRTIAGGIRRRRVWCDSSGRRP